MWLEELVEDSPFLHRLLDPAYAEGFRQGVEEGRLAEARYILRLMARNRFPMLREADLAPVEAISDLERLHALLFGLSDMPDADVFHHALHDAQA